MNILTLNNQAAAKVDMNASGGGAEQPRGADFSFRGASDANEGAKGAAAPGHKRGNSRGSSVGRQNAKARLAALKQTYNSSKLEDMFPVRDSQNFR